MRKGQNFVKKLSQNEYVYFFLYSVFTRVNFIFIVPNLKAINRAISLRILLTLLVTTSLKSGNGEVNFVPKTAQDKIEYMTYQREILIFFVHILIRFSEYGRNRISR